MANQAFDYDLLISVGEAEKRIAQFAKTIERELGSSVEKAFKGSFDFDISPIQRKIKEIESQVKTLGQTFRGSFDFDVGPQAQKMDFLITKAQQLADAVGGNASNAPWMRMQRRMEQVTRLSEELRANFTDPISMTAINQLESKLRAISEDLKGKKSGSFSEAKEWDKAFGDARADFDKGQPARQAAADRELQRAIVAANQLHDLEMRNNQDLASANEASHNKRMRELQREQSAKEAAAKADYQERVSQSQTDITSADERRIANQARITKVFEAEFKRREDLDLEIAARVDSIKTKYLKEQADLVKKNTADKLKAEQDYLQSVEDGQNRIRGEEIQEAESQKKRLEDRKRYTEKFLESGKVGTEKQVQANDRMHERLLRGIQNLTEADKRRYSGLHHFETLIGAVHQKYEAEAKQLILERDALGEREFNNRMQQMKMLHAAEREFAQREATNATNQDLAKFAGGGRAVSNMFQVQQAFEDFQYAGLRGAANNIAMMAANMGGSGGIIALGAIMGAQLATSAGLWDKLNESLGGYLWKLKSVTEEEEKQIKLADARFSAWESNAAQLRSFDKEAANSLDKKAASEKSELQTLGDIVEKLHAAKSAYDSMQSSANALDSMMPRGWTSYFQSSPEESNQMLDYYKSTIKESETALTGVTLITSAQREYASELVRSFEAAKKLWEANAGGYPLTVEGYEAIRKKIDETEASIIKMNSQYETTLWLIKNMKESYEAFSKATKDAYKDSSAFDSSEMKGPAKEFFEEQVKSRQEYVDKLEEEAAKKIELAQIAAAADIEAARQTGNKQREEEARSRLNKIIEEQTRLLTEAQNAAILESEADKTAAEEKTELYKKQEKFQKESLDYYQSESSELQKQVSHTESLIRADEQRLRVLEDQVSAFEDMAGKQAVSLQTKQIAHEASLEKDAYQESMRLGKESFQRQVDYIKEISRQRYEYMKRHNEKGKGDSNPDVMLTEQYNRWKQGFDSWVDYQTKRNEEADRARLKQIERQADLEVKAKFKEYDDAQRAKLKGLEDEAARAESTGDLVTAEQKRSQIAKLLKELSAAQERQVGAGTKEEGRAAYEEWQKINQKIIENAKAEAEIVKIRQEANQNLLNDYDVRLNLIKDKIEQIGSMSMFDLSTEGRLKIYLGLLKAMKDEIAAMAARSASINPGGGGASTPAGRGMPAYAEGTAYVPKTGLALIHKGEMVIPAQMADQIRSGVSYWTGMESRMNSRSGAPPREGPFFSDQNLMKSAETIFGAPAQIMKETGLGEQLAKDVATAIDEGLNSVAAKAKGAIKSVATKARDAAADFYNGGDMGNSLPARFRPFRAIPEAADLHRQAERINESLKRIKDREAELKPTPDPKSSYEPKPYDSPQEASRKRMAEDKARAAKERLDRAESAQRIKDLEKSHAERRQETRDWLEEFGSQTDPRYIRKRLDRDKRDLEAQRKQVEQHRSDAAAGIQKLPGYTENKKASWRDRITPGSPAAAYDNFDDNMRALEDKDLELKQKLIDSGEENLRDLISTIDKIKNHEREKMHQKKKAGLDLENQGWKQKHSGGEGGSYRTGDGEYISPETQALEMRQEAARKRAEQLKRARRLSGQSPSQVEQGDVQDAMKLEQQLQSSAQQKAILERLQAVKASEVGEATALASALERAAAAKAAMASTSSGGYGATGSGVSGGPSGGAGSGYGGGGSPTIINNNMTGVMNNASPQSVFAAMQTAAQISSIRRS